MTYSATEQTLLLDVALASIKHGLQTGNALVPDTEAYPSALTGAGASFVTLKQDDTLRGCIGSLEPRPCLVSNVADNAWAAAFRDPRFPALAAAELASLTIHISVLGALQPVACRSEAQLLEQMQPGVDGWVIQEQAHRGTFLPSVWESLPDPRLFLAHLKEKAGLSANYWSDNIEVWRYPVTSFAARTQELQKSNEGDITAG